MFLVSAILYLFLFKTLTGLLTPLYILRKPQLNNAFLCFLAFQNWSNQQTFTGLPHPLNGFIPHLNVEKIKETKERRGHVPYICWPSQFGVVESFWPLGQRLPPGSGI